MRVYRKIYAREGNGRSKRSKTLHFRPRLSLALSTYFCHVSERTIAFKFFEDLARAALFIALSFGNIEKDSCGI